MNIKSYTEIEGPIPTIAGIVTARAFRKGALAVIFTIEMNGGLLRHVSVSHPIRYPTWDEIKQVREDFFDDKHYVAMFLPPKAEYVNIHPNCFHLWAKTNGTDWE